MQILESAVRDIKTVTATEVYLFKELDGNLKNFLRLKTELTEMKLQ